MSEATFEEQTKQAVQFLAAELREMKKSVEQHTHHIEQLARAVRDINNNLLPQKLAELQEDVDGLKLRLNEIQAKSHRKFAGSGEKPASLDNMD